MANWHYDCDVEDVEKVTNMIIIFIHRWLRPDRELQAAVCQKLEELSPMLRAEVVEVALERTGAERQPFTARLYLAAMGQDYSLESRASTKSAAINQVLAKLAGRILQTRRDAFPSNSDASAASAAGSSGNAPLLFAAS